MALNKEARRTSSSVRCHLGCAETYKFRDHHDRLLCVEHDLDELLDLIELALTWGELDYSSSTVIPPAMWFAFAADHEWADPDRARRIFGLATDVALHSATPAGAAGAQALRSMLRAVEG